jgi:hypothetical protein
VEELNPLSWNAFERLSFRPGWARRVLSCRRTCSLISHARRQLLKSLALVGARPAPLSSEVNASIDGRLTTII